MEWSNKAAPKWQCSFGRWPRLAPFCWSQCIRPVHRCSHSFLEASLRQYLFCSLSPLCFIGSQLYGTRQSWDRRDQWTLHRVYSILYRKSSLYRELRRQRARLGAASIRLAALIESDMVRFVIRSTLSEESFIVCQDETFLGASNYHLACTLYTGRRKCK